MRMSRRVSAGVRASAAKCFKKGFRFTGLNGLKPTVITSSELGELHARSVHIPTCGQVRSKDSSVLDVCTARLLQPHP